MTDTYTIAWSLRCRGCSGESTIATEPDPTGARWKCPHHGEGTDGDFSESGIGEIGDEYEIVDAKVLAAEPGQVETSKHVPDDDNRIAEQTYFADYLAVEVDGMSSTDRAEERGVTGSGIRGNVLHARKALGMEDY